MLSEKLQAAVARLTDLPGDAQDELAARIEAWDALLEDPRGDAFIAELMREAQAGPRYPWPRKEGYAAI